MSNDSSRQMNRDTCRRWTIGVLSNRQVYAGATIVRYEQILLRGIRAAARTHGSNLLLACGVGPDTVPFERRPAWPWCHPQANFVPVGPWNTSGIIAIPPFSEDQQQVLDLWLAQGLPIVFTYPQAGYPSVGPDNGHGIAQALAHLIAHGHRRVAFIAADQHAAGDGAERLAAYRAAVAAHGLPYDRALIGYGGHQVHQSYHALRGMLDAGVDFTAVLASNDESAIGVLRALADARRQVPQDVAVIGFDDVLYAKAQTPPLTTVRHPTFELGYRAVELLLDYLDGRRASLATVRIPTRLIVRESCGCQPYGAPIGRARGRSPAALDLPAVVRAMSDAVAAEARYSDHGMIDQWCRSLVGAFLESLSLEDARPFAAALDRLLRDAEATNDDTYAWQAAISVLREHAGALCAASGPAGSCHVAENLIDQARVRISERLRRQHTRFLVRQAEQTDQLGTMTTRLLTALEPRQILDILADHLPRIGIQHAHVVLFEPAADDPVAWANLYLRAGSAPPEVLRFRSREFPPPGLYDRAEPFQLALVPLIVEGGPSGFVVFDAAYLEPCGLIAEHLAAAFRNSQLHAAAEQGRRLAEEASRLKSRFLSTVSHELRTPLNLIIGLSEMLLREQDGAPSQDLERIYAHAQHLGRLIGDVLDLAGSEAGQLRLHLEPLDLAEALQVVVATGAQMAREHGLEWRANMPPAGAWVRGDRTRLRQVALNLISNAVKFTERGTITLDLLVGDGSVTVAVSDTGPGVPPADQQQIFEEFHTSERTADRAYGGLGLGLTICKQLVERHGGTINVRSPGQEHSGATFFFTLPLLPAQMPVECATELPGRLPVVFLTECADCGDPLGATLHERGFDVRIQRIDAEADWLPWLIAAPPGAIMLDEALAARRGWEILGVLKRHPATAQLPVLMYGFDSGGGQGALLELDYMLKPLDPEQLARALERQRISDVLSPGARTILIVDDDPDTLALHARLVRQQLAECRVVQARGGREALALMERTRPNLVLLDLMMPDLDGFAVLEAMRARATLLDVPVVVLTARMLTEEDMARLNAGVAAILSKGLFSADEILGHIESALAHHHKLGSVTQLLVRRAVAFIHAHSGEPIARDQIAAHVGVSADHLTACFRHEMGVTPIAYLNRYRISRARTLLEEGRRSITDVALEAGFSDPANFSRTFHREVGMTPNAYRRAHQR